ncbi:hypothetical protein H4219_004918 [Mycoemilia scoparia]|uniref:Uncharacterized protein n=1 Tax=Mycoemilia scoparia TaxID=417184 RepID=A0A9W8DQJ1_9FUNG|nr:hypothetical protein H4219_004918 [Mycoemilia scoparia]
MQSAYFGRFYTTAAVSSRLFRPSFITADKINGRCGWFSTSANKRSSNSHMHDEADIEKFLDEKNKAVKGKSESPFEHAPNWSEFLASHSEAAIKADQEVEITSFEELQMKTKDIPRKKS